MMKKTTKIIIIRLLEPIIIAFLKKHHKQKQIPILLWIVFKKNRNEV